MAVRSCDIKLALSKRHEKDYFLTEVKDGPTVRASHARIDAWAMKKSWSPDVYYQTLDLMYEVSKAKKKISECRNCGRVIIGECERCVSQNN